MAALATKLSRYRFSPSSWSLGLKAGVILTLCLCISFSSFIYFFAKEQNKLADMAQRQNMTISHLLADEISGAVRWQRPDVIDQVVERFQAQQEGDLKQVVVWDRHGELLFGQVDTAIERPEAASQGPSLSHFDGVQTTISGSNMIVALPVRNSPAGSKIGHMQATWSLERIHGLVRESVWQDVWIAVVEFLILIVGFLFLLRSQLTGPIQVMTSSMSRLAAGDLEIDVPDFNRRDEIGAMAKAVRVFRANAIMVKQVTEELKVQADRLEDALSAEKELNGLQRQFVAMVSHEFRTPLAIIDGNAQRLIRRHDEIAPERLKTSLGKIRISVLRLTELMESVLSTANLEAGSIKFEPLPCSLVDLIQEVANNHQEVNSDHRIISDLELLPETFPVDAKLMRQVMSNLVSNAVKYSPKGTRVWVEGKAVKDGGVQISVRDEGVGIPAAEIDKLFERFFRASTSTGIVGTGIGLHMVKALVDMHSGEVDVTSTEDEGTTFSVRLPGNAPSIETKEEAA